MVWVTAAADVPESVVLTEKNERWCGIFSLSIFIAIQRQVVTYHHLLQVAVVQQRG